MRKKMWLHMMNGKFFATIGAVFILINTLGWCALPPSKTTKKEVSWNQLSKAAQKDFNSPETIQLMDAFFRKYIDQPRAINVRYMYAERQFRSGNYRRAAVGYEKFLRLYPKHELSDSATYRLAECYYNLKVYKSAANVWNKLVDNYPNSALVPDALEKLALLQMRAKEWGKADELFKRLGREFEDYAQVPRIRENAGIVQFYLDDLTDSAQALEGIDSEKASYYRGLSLFSLHLYGDAVAVLKNAAQAKAGPFVESAGYLKAEGFFQKKNYNIASSEFAGFIKRFPTSSLVPYAQVRRAACALLVNDHENALAHAEESLKGKTPNTVTAHALFIKGSALLELQKYGPAANIFTLLAAKKEFPDLAAAAWVRKAWAHKNLEQASELHKSIKALEINFPGSSQIGLAKFLEGAQLYEDGKWDEAGGKFQAGVLGCPYNAISEAGLALMTLAYTKANRLDQLVTASHAAMKIFEQNYSSESLYWRPPAYYFIGRAYYETGRFKEAIPFFETVTTKFTDHEMAPPAQLLLGWSLCEINEFDRAREKARTLIGNPKISAAQAVKAEFLFAATYFNAKDYDKALVSLADFIQKNPKDPLVPQVRYMMGLGFHQKKVYGSVIEEWSKLITDYPDHPLSQDAYLQVGDLYFKSGDYAKAATYFQQFREKWPVSQFAQTALWQECQANFNGRLDDAALKSYPIFIQTYPSAENITDAKNQLELVYFRRGEQGDPDKLEDFLSRYPKGPFAPAARYKLGDMAIQQKKWNRAASEMEQFVRDYPNDKQLVDALYGLGLSYENLEEHEKAVVQYRNIMSQFSDKPGAVDAAFRLGSLHFKAQRYKEAVEAFEFAQKKKMPTSLQASVNFNLALCYENLGRLEEAAAAYGNFSNLTKDADQKREAVMNAGLLFKKAEMYSKAIPYFERLLKDPGQPMAELQAVNLLAESHQKMGKDAAAIKTYEKLIGMEPASSDLRVAGLAQLAYLCEKKKDFEKAIRIYEKISISDGKAEWVKAAVDRMDALSTDQNQEP